MRVATYKLAMLMALIDHCIENLPVHPADQLAVPIPDLAHRVLQLYWRQVRPFEGHDLRQSSGEKERIPRAVRALRAATPASSLSVAMTLAPEVYQTSIDEIGLCLAQQPLYRLQRLPGGDTNDPFLYDDSFLHANVSRRTLRTHGDAIALMPGVAAGLARLAGLLKPALEIMWVDDVRRMNIFLTAEVPDIAGHLFGRDRTALAAVRGPFKDAFGARCFYCDTNLRADNPIDHVLPWSLVDRVLGRDREKLEQIADAIRWPAEYPRVVAAARGIYGSQPPGIATWSGYQASVRLDIAFAPRWMDSPS